MILFVESPGSKKRRIGAILVLLMFFASLAFLMNDYRLSGSTSEKIRREKSWARSGVMPDIMVSGIEVQPFVPHGGEPFVVNVFCQNIGIVATGRYVVEVTVTDRYGNKVFSGHSFRNDALDPGQIGAAFSTSITLEKASGRYTIAVLVNPDGFEDSNSENNRGSRVIDVL